MDWPKGDGFPSSEVIGILLGQENSVRNIRAGAEGVLQKMVRILEE